MDTLEKFFKAIKSAPSPRLKLYSTKELIKQLPEYSDNLLYILKNVYEMLCSEDGFLRSAGASILGSIKLFSYHGVFDLRTTVSTHVYLQCKEIIDGPAVPAGRQKSSLVKKLKLDHVDAKFLDMLVEGSEGVRHKSKKNVSDVKENDKDINNVYDFFEAININIFSSDWFRRHGALLAHIAIFSNNKIINKDNSKECEGDLNNKENKKITGKIRLKKNKTIKEKNSNAEKFDKNVNNEVKNDQTTGEFCNNKDSNNLKVNDTKDIDTKDIDIKDNTTKYVTNNTESHSNIIETVDENNKIVIRLNSNLFCKVYEILNNDKFNDFLDDKTSAPVRESAAKLLKEIFPYLNEDGVTALFIEFLKNDDWQVQFSGMLVLLALKRELIGNKRRVYMLLDNLVPFLNSEDEDIKYMASELLDFIFTEVRIDMPYVEDVFQRCWEEIVDCDEIGHSKAYVLVLLKNLFRKYSVPNLESYNPLHLCFTSSIMMVKQSVVELCEFICNEELLYLLGESIILNPDSLPYREDNFYDIAVNKLSNNIASENNNLQVFSNTEDNNSTLINNNFEGSNNKIENNSKSSDNEADNNFLNTIESNNTPGVSFNCLEKAVKILKKYMCKTRLYKDVDDANNNACNIDSNENNSFMNYEAIMNFGTHFSRIIGGDLYQPYNENDFVCYDDSFFTYDGIRALGFNLVLNNRLKMFEVLCEIPGFTLNEDMPNMLFQSFSIIINKIIKNSNENNDISNKGINNNPVKESNVCNGQIKLEDIIEAAIGEDFKTIPILKKMPKGEFMKIINDFSYSSPYPLCNSYAIEYFRLVLLRYISSVSQKNFNNCSDKNINDNVFDACFYYCVEYNLLFLRLITKILVNIMSVGMLERAYSIIISEMRTYKKTGRVSLPLRNFVVLFSMLGDRVSTVINHAISDPDCLLFFETTVKYFIKNQACSSYLPQIFDIALREKRIEVLKHFLADITYNEMFVRHMLTNFDPRLFSEVIDYSNPIFHCLFVRKTIKAFSNPENGKYAKKLLSSIIPTLYFSSSNRISTDLQTMIEEEKKIAMMLLSPKEIPEYKLACKIPVQLREYQKEGIKWLSFLARFYLNGILADDMGLGKTLQILSFMISEMIKRMSSNSMNQTNSNASVNQADSSNRFIEREVTKDKYGYKDKEKDYCNNNNDFAIYSLIICPSSLTTHWKDEITKYFSTYFGKEIHCNIYNNKTKEVFKGITIATYDNLRRDTGALVRDWYFVVFDEGHLLKSRSTQLYAKAQLIRGEHKFILTGTPVHNSVEDLFSLFNLIMPGYLGTETEFMNTYGVKITDKNVDVMENKLAALNKKILPFIMRRLKADVLKDLPPKIIKDVIVDLFGDHLKIYNEAAISNEDNRKENNNIDDKYNNNQKDSTDNNCINACNFNNITEPTTYAALNASGLSHTRKLLKAASHPCYFTSGTNSSKTAALQDIFNIVGEKKVLVFFQNKQTIDFVIDELALANYVRLDGSVPLSQRANVISKFVNEPVRYFFLTTSIGGLGLNLVVADVVVFYEHDWNPFNDLQAMDRAHRLGQLNTVHVFRLIARNTIEERVMNFQNFKMHIASSIVSQQNTNVEKMDTKDLLERFDN